MTQIYGAFREPENIVLRKDNEQFSWLAVRVNIIFFPVHTASKIYKYLDRAVTYYILIGYSHPDLLLVTFWRLRVTTDDTRVGIWLELYLSREPRLQRILTGVKQ